jgi:Coenzyme PQQ synthesis protein D (PqqD)
MYDALLSKYVIRIMEDKQNQASAGAWTGYPKHIDGLDISPADGGYIIYRAEQDRVHFLNPTAVLILEFCSGTNSPDQIVELVKQSYGLTHSPVEEVNEALRQLNAEGLLLYSDGLV